MNRSQRPGGLTALGFIHILMFASYGFGLVGSVIGIVSNRNLVIEVYGSIGTFGALMTANGLMALLLLGNGVGLLKVSRLMGRNLSLVLLVVALADAATTITLAPRAFSVMSIAGLAYALMAAGLVWSVFRRDFDSREGRES